jgi:hypothetical protein
MRPKFLNVIRPLEDYIDPETGQVRWFDDDGDYIEKGWDETKRPPKTGEGGRPKKSRGNGEARPANNKKFNP